MIELTLTVTLFPTLNFNPNFKSLFIIVSALKLLFTITAKNKRSANDDVVYGSVINNRRGPNEQHSKLT